MKTFLLGTSALIGAVALAASANAQSPKVTVGGFLDFQAGFADQDLDAGVRDYHFANDSEVHISVDGRSDNGLGYGAVIELEADVTADAEGEGLNSDKTYLYLDGGWGRTEMGSNISASDALRVDASTFARGTGGIDGDFHRFANVLYITPELPTAQKSILGGAAEDATKLTYYTPRFSGFQAGLSYAPDSGDTGTSAAFTGDVNGDFENVFHGGLNYNGQISSVGLAASATGEIGDGELPGQDDLQAWALGLNLSYMGFTLGGHWMDWDDSIGADVDAWSLGAGYVTGPFGLSVTWLDADIDGLDDVSELSFGADYQLAPGLVPYAELTFYEGVSRNAVFENDATVFILGTQLTF